MLYWSEIYYASHRGNKNTLEILNSIVEQIVSFQSVYYPNQKDVFIYFVGIGLKWNYFETAMIRFSYSTCNIQKGTHKLSSFPLG